MSNESSTGGHTHRNRRHTEETKAKMSSTMKVVANTPEARAKNSLSKIKYYQNPVNRAYRQVLCDRDEYREKRQQIFESKEHRKRLSDNAKALWADLEYRKRVAEAQVKASVDPVVRRNKSESHKRTWQNPDYVKKQMRARGVKPNKPELFLSSVLNELYPGDWKYVGDGEVIIAGKCPDFINCNGRKLIIELFGDYFHRGQDPEERKNVFRPYGYETLVIWEKEIKDLSRLENTIKKFVEDHK